jgi:hypothetical protein
VWARQVVCGARLSLPFIQCECRFGLEAEGHATRTPRAHGRGALKALRPGCICGALYTLGALGRSWMTCTLACVSVKALRRSQPQPHESQRGKILTDASRKSLRRTAQTLVGADEYPHDGLLTHDGPAAPRLLCVHPLYICVCRCARVVKSYCRSPTLPWPWGCRRQSGLLEAMCLSLADSFHERHVVARRNTMEDTFEAM